MPTQQPVSSSCARGPVALASPCLPCLQLVACSSQLASARPLSPLVPALSRCSGNVPTMLILTNVGSCDHGHRKPQHSVCNISTGSTSTCTDEVPQERDPNGVMSRSSRDLCNLSPTSHRASAWGGPVQDGVWYYPVVLGTYFVHITQAEGYWDAVPSLVSARGLPTRNYHLSRRTTPLNPKPSIAFDARPHTRCHRPMQCSRFKQVANQHLVVTAKRINSGCWCFLSDVA